MRQTTALQPLVDRRYRAGADLPVIVLPPERSLQELEYALEVLRPHHPLAGES